jgi:hypothetical protein
MARRNRIGVLVLGSCVAYALTLGIGGGRGGLGNAWAQTAPATEPAGPVNSAPPSVTSTPLPAQEVAAAPGGTDEPAAPAPSPPAPSPPAPSPPAAPAPAPSQQVTPPAQPVSTKRIRLAPPFEAEPQDPTVRTHDGFYARLGSGFAAWSEQLSTVEDDAYDGPMRVETTGIAKVDDLMLGWSLAPNWVLGLSLQTANLLANTSRAGEDNVANPPAEVDTGLRDMVLLGPSAVWFSNPKGGFNLGFGLAVGGVSVKRIGAKAYSTKTQYEAGGLALNLEVGHTFWIAEQWSVGLRGRVNAAYFRGTDDDGVNWEHSVGVSPGALFDVTYH